MVRIGKYTATGEICTKDGTVPYESLSPEAKKEHRKACAERMSKSMSRYYTAHPEQWKKLCESLD